MRAAPPRRHARRHRRDRHHGHRHHQAGRALRGRAADPRRPERRTPGPRTAVGRRRGHGDCRARRTTAGLSTDHGLTRALRALAPEGADAVLDYVPDGPASVQSLAALRPGGTLVHMGANRSPLLPPLAAITVNCWKVVCTRSCTRTDAQEVLTLLADGALSADELITHRFSLADVEAAVAAMQSRSEPMWMAVVSP
ncbi:zinc-binding dehydrogenase [Streptomyces sp. NPDC056987]|uniref:zinc-binding dehydrogenase n=1 Tax=Streptomyces sp. NPDC056987 TaxID=3345988 RepID=UPI00362D7ED9